MDVSTSPAVAEASARPPTAEPTTRRSGWLGQNWVLEAAGFLALAGLYMVVRSFVRGSETVAFLHAQDILSIEHAVFEAVEVPLNRWMVGLPVVAVAACYLYALLHYAATPIVLVLSRRRGGWLYQRGFWTLILASALAVLVYALYPLAPPRLVPGLGVVDVMREFSEWGWWGSAASAPRGIGDATNQFAAMPSMHFGWALWCAMQMWGFGTTRWRVLAVAYPSVLAVVVIATANHFLLDLVGGAACVLVAYALVTWIRSIAVRRTARSAGRGPLLDAPG